MTNLQTGLNARSQMRWRARGITLGLLLIVILEMQAQDFTYTNVNGTITITGYAGPGGAVTIPSRINGLAVTGIGTNAFANWASLTNITIPNGVTNIEDGAFSVSGLTSVELPESVMSLGTAFSYCSK